MVVLNVIDQGNDIPALEIVDRFRADAGPHIDPDCTFDLVGAAQIGPHVTGDKAVQKIIDGEARCLPLPAGLDGRRHWLASMLHFGGNLESLLAGYVRPDITV